MKTTTFIDARKQFAEERKALIYRDLAGHGLSEAKRQELAEKITQSMHQYDTKNFSSQGHWSNPQLTDC